MTRVLVLLPETPSPTPEAHWWRVENGAVVERGSDTAWIPLSAAPAELIALAPSASIRLSVADMVGTTDKQSAAVAAASAREQGLADPATLHAVSAVSRAGPQPAVWTAVAANSAMLQWLDWLAAFDRDPVAIVPVALALPVTTDWAEARVGNDHVVGRGPVRFTHEPALAAALIGAEPVRSLPEEQVEAMLVQLADTPFLNLRQGRFARRRTWVLDKARVRELALLAACIPLLALIMALVTIVRLDRDADRLDAEAIAAATGVVGRPVTAELALTEIDQTARLRGGAGGTMAAPLAALYQQLQSEPAVGLTVLGWRSDGTLSTTLAAPRTEELNRVLLSLQRSGYTVTAVPRSSPDGRQLADITLRSGA